MLHTCRGTRREREAITPGILTSALTFTIFHAVIALLFHFIAARQQLKRFLLATRLHDEDVLDVSGGGYP